MMTIHRNALLAFILLLASPAGAVFAKDEPAKTADDAAVIVANANILTMNPGQERASAMAFRGGRIIAVGDLDTVKKAAGGNYEYYDLEGRTVVPGFIESHDHMVNHGGALAYADITPFRYPTLKEALKRLASVSPGEDGWIVAWAIDPTLYREKRGPTRQELDRLFPDTPVFLWHMSGHGGYANSKALQLAGIDRNTPDPKGGEYVKDSNGNLNGYLKGQPAALSVYKLPVVDIRTTLHAARVRAEQGFTSATELAFMHPRLLKVGEDATAEPDFPVRLYGGVTVSFPGLEEVVGQIRNYENNRFRIRYIKTWTDGSTQGGTGYFTEPYYRFDADTRKGARGTQDDFNRQVTLILQNGFTPAIHANGDAAMDLALNAIEYARKKTGRLDIRPHLIHCQYVRPDQFDRIARMGNIGMTFFTAHIYYWGDMHRDVLLGPKRASQIAAVDEAIKRGIPYAIHNDPPVTPPNALFSMWVAVNRLTSSGKHLGPEHRITTKQALLAYTREAAMVLGIEDEVGTLEKGKYADFAVLSDDPLQVEPMKIKDIEVLATVLGGNISFSRSEIYSTALPAD